MDSEEQEIRRMAARRLANGLIERETAREILRLVQEGEFDRALDLLLDEN